jgi:cytochrome P450
MRPTVLESLRLWPTTPAILRETTTETNWADRTLPAGATMLIYTPFFHRAREHTRHADAYAPELWGEESDPYWAFPFSAGQAACPGRQLVTLVCSALLTRLLDHTRLRQAHPSPIRDKQPLPATLSPFRLRYEPRP